MSLLKSELDAKKNQSLRFFVCAMYIRYFLLDIFCPLIVIKVFFVRLKKSSLLDALFILKHRIAVPCHGIAISCHKIAVLRFKITNASLLMYFIFWVGLFMFPDRKTFFSG